MSRATYAVFRAVALQLFLLFALFGLAQAQSGAAQLSIHDGVIVKFGPGAGLHVRDRLHTGAGVVLTSQQDDSALGPVDEAQPGSPQAGDWLGLLVDAGVPAAQLRIDGLGIRWAGGAQGLPSHIEGGAGLVLGAAPYSLQRLELSHNTVGMRLIGSGSATIS